MQHRKLNNELARPMGIVDGTRVGGQRGHRTRTRTIALTDTTVTRPDGSSYTIKRSTRTNTAKQRTRTKVVADSTRANLTYQPTSRYQHNFN